MRVTITNGTDNSLIYTETVQSMGMPKAVNNTDSTATVNNGISDAGMSTTSDNTYSSGSTPTVSFADTLAATSGVQKSDKYSAVMSYKEIFEEAASKYGLDVNLLYAMAKQESDFDAKATSKSGAMGIMQLMPQTAKELGVSDPYDPYESIMAGADYISRMIKSYDGNVEMALAAYNAGPTTVAMYNGIPPFTHTKEYVNNILAMKANGVDVPNYNYVKKTATDEQLMADLNSLMERYQSYPSYTEFNNAMYDILATKDYTGVDSKVAYADMLKEANGVINNIISKS